MLRSIESFLERWDEIQWQLQNIPLLLRLTVILSLIVGVIVPLTVLIPNPWGLKVNSTSFSWLELWRTGLAFALLAYGPIHLAIPYGVFQRTNWVRPVLICLPLVQIMPFEVVQLVFGPQEVQLSLYQYFPITLGFSIFLVVYVIAVGAYLYSNKSVRSYFHC